MSFTASADKSEEILFNAIISMEGEYKLSYNVLLYCLDNKDDCRNSDKIELIVEEEK